MTGHKFENIIATRTHIQKNCTTHYNVKKKCSWIEGAKNRFPVYLPLIIRIGNNVCHNLLTFGKVVWSPYC